MEYDDEARRRTVESEYESDGAVAAGGAAVRAATPPAPPPPPASAAERREDDDGDDDGDEGSGSGAGGGGGPPAPGTAGAGARARGSGEEEVRSSKGKAASPRGAGGSDAEEAAAAQRRPVGRQRQRRGADPWGLGHACARGHPPVRQPQQPQPQRHQQRQPPPQQQQQQPQPQPQRVVLSVPTWIGHSLSRYSSTVNKRMAVSALGVAAVVAVSVGSTLIATSGARSSSSSSSSGGMAGNRYSGGRTYSSTSSSLRSGPGGDVGSGVVGAASPPPPPPDVILPPAMDAYADFNEPKSSDDVPVFLHVPRSGGLTMMEILGRCADLVLASDVGVRDGRDGDTELKVIETPSGSYVNCDTTTAPGIDRCTSLNLVPSGLVDVISTPLPYRASALFATSKRRGRLFVLLRPVADRSYSYYRRIRDAVWDAEYDPRIARMTAEEYADLTEDRPEFNWLTKALCGRPGRTTAALTSYDLNVAKEVLRRKAAVGMLSHKGDSLLRFDGYFGWSYGNAESKTCEEELLHWEWRGKGGGGGNGSGGNGSGGGGGGGTAASAHGRGSYLDPNGMAYRKLEARNAWDVELYRYAEGLFVDQGDVFHGGGGGGGMTTTTKAKDQQP